MIKDKIMKAYNFAEKAHGDTPRKYSDLLYFSHPKGVARIIEELTGEEDLIITALLHDTIEDTEVTYKEIRGLFGERIANLVKELSSDKTEQKVLGKTLYLTKKMVEMTPDALTVKLADRLHNILYLQEDTVPRKFIDKYYKETRHILHMANNMRIEGFTMNQVILYNKIETILDFLQIRYKYEN